MPWEEFWLAQLWAWDHANLNGWGMKSVGLARWGHLAFPVGGSLSKWTIVSPNRKPRWAVQCSQSGSVRTVRTRALFPSWIHSYHVALIPLMTGWLLYFQAPWLYSRDSLPGKIQFAQLNLNFRRTVNNFFTVTPTSQMPYSFLRCSILWHSSFSYFLRKRA